MSDNVDDDSINTHTKTSIHLVEDQKMEDENPMSKVKSQTEYNEEDMQIDVTRNSEHEVQEVSEDKQEVEAEAVKLENTPIDETRVENRDVKEKRMSKRISLAPELMERDDKSNKSTESLSIIERDDEDENDSEISLTVSHTGVSLFSSYHSGSVMTEVVEEPKEEVPAIDRELYYNLYEQHLKEFQVEKAKNNFLQKKLVDYYKKRKQEHLIGETNVRPEFQKRYEKQLEQAEVLIENSEKRKIEVHQELKHLKESLETKISEVNNLFQKLLTEQYQVSKEMKDLPDDKDKLIDRYIRRQKVDMNNKNKMRLKYVKIKNMYLEKLEALDKLDNFGPNLHLIDYEQLKVDNRNHKDKLEERDVKLTALRAKVKNNMQILAHSREKAAALDADIKKVEQELEFVDEDWFSARERLDSIKREKGHLRMKIQKMKEESGLLFFPRLICDLEKSLTQVETVAEIAQETKRHFYELDHQLKQVRGNISDYKSVKRRDTKRLSESFLPMIEDI